MSRVVSTALVLAAVLAAGTGGYWLAQERAGVLMSSVAGQPAQQPSGPVIYYQDPDGKPSYSAEPKRTADGRPYRAVYASEDVSFDEPEQQAATSAPAGRKILYYRHPMGLPDVSKAPKKDSMGMDYIPVYEGEDADSTTVKVSAGKRQRIGVSTEPATLRAIAVPVRVFRCARKHSWRRWRMSPPAQWCGRGNRFFGSTVRPSPQQRRTMPLSSALAATHHYRVPANVS